MELTGREGVSQEIECLIITSEGYEEEISNLKEA